MKTRFKFALGLIGLMLFCTLSYSGTFVPADSPTTAVFAAPTTFATADVSVSDVYSFKSTVQNQIVMYAILGKSVEMRIGISYRPYSKIYSYPTNSTLKEKLLNENWRDIKAELNRNYLNSLRAVAPNT